MEHGGDLIEVLDPAIKEKAGKLVEKSILAKTTALDLDKDDMEELDIIKM